MAKAKKTEHDNARFRLNLFIVYKNINLDKIGIVGKIVVSRSIKVSFITKSI